MKPVYDRTLYEPGFHDRAHYELAVHCGNTDGGDHRGIAPTTGQGAGDHGGIVPTGGPAGARIGVPSDGARIHGPTRGGDHGRIAPSGGPGGDRIELAAGGQKAASGGQAAALHGFDFRLPPDLAAAEPPEARGLGRDQVRLMVSYRTTDRVAHLQFRDLPCVLDPGDVLVINTSGTLNAALPAELPDGRQLELHLSTHLPGGLWSVELREPGERGTAPYEGAAGLALGLPAGATATLLAPYVREYRGPAPRRKRLWLAALQTQPAGQPIGPYLERHGFPIRYGYVSQPWPAEYYQNVYATEPGSAEMPSAGRPFTAELLARLVAAGIWIAPLLLHTGVASLEEDEAPYEEFYRVPAPTAHLINTARSHGRRVIAVGTTAVRAVETTADEEGIVHPGAGWTGLVVTPGYRLRGVDALLTGLHEPRSTHLAMLQAFTGRDHLRLAYSEALRERYLWHEFGDVHLIL